MRPIMQTAAAHNPAGMAATLAAVEAFAGAATDADTDSPDAEHGPIADEIVRQAFATMSSPGRLEVVRRSPMVIADAAHNPAGMAATVAALTEAFTFSGLIRSE